MTKSKPGWDDTIQDLKKLSLSPKELKRKKEILKRYSVTPQELTPSREEKDWRDLLSNVSKETWQKLLNSQQKQKEEKENYNLTQNQVNLHKEILDFLSSPNVRIHASPLQNHQNTVSPSRDRFLDPSSELAMKKCTKSITECLEQLNGGIPYEIPFHEKDVPAMNVFFSRLERLFISLKEENLSKTMMLEKQRLKIVELEKQLFTTTQILNGTNDKVETLQKNLIEYEEVSKMGFEMLEILMTRQQQQEENIQSLFKTKQPETDSKNSK